MPALALCSCSCLHPKLPSAEPACVSSWEPCRPEPGRVTLVTIVGANMREGQEVNSVMLSPWGSHWHRASPVPASRWLPCNTLLSSPIPHIRGLGGFATGLLLPLPRQLEYYWFYSHLCANQLSIWFGGCTARTGSNCDAADGGCIGATKPEGNTSGLGSPGVANR